MSHATPINTATATACTVECPRTHSEAEPPLQRLWQSFGPAVSCVHQHHRILPSVGNQRPLQPDLCGSVCRHVLHAPQRQGRSHTDHDLAGISTPIIQMSAPSTHTHTHSVAVCQAEVRLCCPALTPEAMGALTCCACFQHSSDTVWQLRSAMAPALPRTQRP